MEPVQKKAKLTSHFRVALKPYDENTQRSFKQRNQDVGKENVEVITINDDENNEDCNKKQQPQPPPQRQQQKQSQQNLREQQEQLKEYQQPDEINLRASTSKQQQQQQQQPPKLRRINVNNNSIIDSDNNTSNGASVQEHQKSAPRQPTPILRDQSIELELKAVELAAELGLDDSGDFDTVGDDTDKPEETNLDVSGVHGATINKYFPPPFLPSYLIDHDETLLDDVWCEPYYAWDSFQYDREQEKSFRNFNYFEDELMEHEITPERRAKLIEWLVQLQNMFELDHEPLYMAVKLADQYLMRRVVQEEDLELLFMTSLLISAKFDERLTPLQTQELISAARAKYGVRYTKSQITSLEVDILRTLNFNLRLPLSYGFLRRFARCTQSDRRTLHLARYILESSLLESRLIEELESKIAAGSLLLAFRMLQVNQGSCNGVSSRQQQVWSMAAEFYTGYKLVELNPLVLRLNNMIANMANRNSAIRKKYSHPIYMEVAKVSPVAMEVARIPPVPKQIQV